MAGMYVNQGPHIPAQAFNCCLVLLKYNRKVRYILQALPTCTLSQVIAVQWRSQDIFINLWKHGLRGEYIAASVLLKLFINGNERWHPMRMSGTL